MKFTTLTLSLLASLLPSAALAQNAFIMSPTTGTDVTRGTNITVQVSKPNSLTGSTSVAIALGLRTCEPTTIVAAPSCAQVPSQDFFGNVLYSGPFQPVYHNPTLPPYQNYTVYVPQGFVNGSAVLSLAHFVLIGAGPETILDVTNTTVNVL